MLFILVFIVDSLLSGFLPKNEALGWFIVGFTKKRLTKEVCLCLEMGFDVPLKYMGENDDQPVNVQGSPVVPWLSRYTRY